jgi:plasmid replication initiation protein
MTDKGKRHTFNRNDIIDMIIKWRIDDGLTRLNILDRLKKEYKYSQSYSYDLIRDASKEFNERTIQNFGEDIKEDIERFEMLYSSSIQEGNKKLAMELLREISKLKGHYVERINLNGKIEFNAKFPGFDDKNEEE